MRLKSLANSLQEAQPAAEGAAPHLVDHVTMATRLIWQQMKDSYAEEFEVTLRRLGWPKESMVLNGPLQEEWVDKVKQLLELQQPELRAGADASESGDTDPFVLLPLEIMMKPLELRFKYHFEGDRPTNKLEKVSYS